jgi:hypothetical protein
MINRRKLASSRKLDFKEIGIVIGFSSPFAMKTRKDRFIKINLRERINT